MDWISGGWKKDQVRGCLGVEVLKLDGRAGAKEMGDESREEGAQEGKGRVRSGSRSAVQSKINGGGEPTLKERWGPPLARQVRSGEKPSASPNPTYQLLALLACVSITDRYTTVYDTDGARLTVITCVEPFGHAPRTFT